MGEETESKEPTPLDKVLEALSGNPDLVEDYYTLFLNSSLCIPVRKATGSGGVEPVTTEKDGQSYVPAFDLPERLARWAQRDMDFSVIGGYDLLKSLQPHGLLIALNPDESGAKLFSREETDWLLENAEATTAE